MIKAIIFDLDNCLAAADESGRQLLAPTFAAIRRAESRHAQPTRRWSAPLTHAGDIHSTPSHESTDSPTRCSPPAGPKTHTPK